MSSSNHSPAAPRGRAGVTLVELMVAVVIMGILTTVLWQLVRSQSSFVAFESQREDAQDNARAALDILAGDLRAAPPRGIIDAQAQSLVLAIPKAWGVVCNTASTGTQMDVVFPPLPADAFTVTATSGSGLMVNTSATSTPSWLPRPTADAARAVVDAAVAQNLAVCTSNPAGNGLMVYRFTGSNFPAAAMGQAVMFYQVVKYDVGASEGRQWVRRSTALTGANAFTMSPMAGPLKSADALAFTYYSGAAATLVAAPGTVTATLDALSRVKVKVTTASAGTYNGKSTEQADSSAVLLRNRERPLQCGDPALNPPAPC